MKNNLLPSLFVTILFAPLLAIGQQAYVDPGTTAALYAHANSLKDGQNAIERQQNKLQKAQAFVATQLAAVNQVQNKIYEGLSEVSGTLQNGIQIKTIINELDQCRMYYKNVKELVIRHPQYAIFGATATKKAIEKITEIAAEITSVKTGGKDHLMTAGDRYRLLDNIESKIRSFKLWLITIQLALENAETLGFWKSINPFQGYIDTDKDIIQNIMRKFKNYY